MGCLLGHIWELSEHCLEGVVLFGNIVQVLGVVLDVVVAKDVLEKLEGMEVWVGIAWGIIEDSDVGVDHLVISGEEKSWGIDGSLGVVDLSRSGLWD